MAADYRQLAGRFLVLDGPDGGGKSTQLEMLADQLRASGLEVLSVREPGGTAIGEKIRGILLDRRHDDMAVICEMLLYMASRAQLVAQRIVPALAAGQCVLADRFVWSTIAYQGAAGADVEAIRQVAQVAVAGAWPDLTVILDLPAEAGLARLKRDKDRLEQRDQDYHRRVRQSYLDQARQAGDCAAVIDASAGPDQVQQALRGAVEAWLARIGPKA